MKNKIKFSKQALMDHDLPFGGSDVVDLVESKLVDHTRWSVHYEIIFKWTDGKYYKTEYSEGATEMQDEGPWEYQDEVECIEVYKVQRLVDVWEDRELFYLEEKK